MQAAAAAGPGEETMGASTSWGLLTPVPAPHHEPQEAPGLNQLPIEMLRKVLSYLPPSMLLRHCRPVCRRWRDVVDGWDLWRSILPWRHPDLWPVIRTCLPPADAPGPCILGRFCERRPIGRNLLRKPRGLGGSPGKRSYSREKVGGARRMGRLDSVNRVELDPRRRAGVSPKERQGTWALTVFI